MDGWSASYRSGGSQERIPSTGNSRGGFSVGPESDSEDTREGRAHRLFSFHNPWADGTEVTSHIQQQQQQQQQQLLPIPDTDQYARRKSSLVVPPSRVHNPLPYEQPLTVAQHLPATPDAQEFYRRQSVATAGTYYRPQPFAPLRSSSLEPPRLQICHSVHELQPTLNKTPKYRRASVHSKTISPLVALTKNLTTTYSLCSSLYTYKTSRNPRRVLTKPSEGQLNHGFDNVNSDYILYVNDVLGVESNRKYMVLDILGHGTFGQVVKCQNLSNKEIIAVKVIKSRSEYLNQSLTETKILELINEKIDPHDRHHFLRFYDSFVHKNHLCLAFELLSNNLYELLKQNKFHGLSLNLIRTFTIQLLDSLSILKDNKLIHCDLKPENVLLCSPDKPDIKIIDFGSSCEETRTIYTYIQSRFYRAPEIILGIPYSTSIDMWSLGCIVAELFLGIPIFPGASEYNQLTRIISTLGLPPNWMIDMGKNSSKYMKTSEMLNGPRYRLKTLDEYNLEMNGSEQPSKQYFKWNELDKIILNYRLPKNILNSEELIDQEMHQRACLVHFLRGILNINPLERWTPQQAMVHPFVTQQPFTGVWYPPGSMTGNPSMIGFPKRSNTGSNNGKVSFTHDASPMSNEGNSYFQAKKIRHQSVQEGPMKEFHNLKIMED